jgi:DNA helicase-2/ATP-dependent DNA helicase PcrA
MAPDRLLTLITRLIESDVGPEAAEQFLDRRGFGESKAAGEAYKAYWKQMIATNALDFPSLIREALVLLRDVAGIRKQVLRIYKYICVDEFQDTNLIQYKLLKQLADDDQIIYQWNGASPERIKKLENDFGMSTIQLPENYRCPPQVVEIANALIQHNFERAAGKLPLRSHKRTTDNSPVTLQGFHDFAEEAQWVAQTIAAYPASRRADCVVLARARKVLEAICDELSQHNVPSYLAVKKGQFETPPLIFIHSLLRLANSRAATEHLRRVAKAFYALEGIDIDVRDVVARSSEVEGDLLRAWIRSALARETLEGSTRQFLTSAVSNLAERLDYREFVNAAFPWVESLPLVVAGGTGKANFDDYPVEKETFEALFAEIASHYGTELTLNVLLQELDLRSKAPLPPRGAVPCFTVHASKGLEFKHVFLAGMVEDQLPSWAAVKKGDHSREMQEERRNCFVAITRAQESLTLTYSTRMGGWAKRPSRFLSEMGLL